MRVKRGTLRSEKAEDGRVYVWVNVNPDGDPNGVHSQGEVDPYRELIDELHARSRRPTGKTAASSPRSRVGSRP
jgi:hypothetical protein